MCPLAVTECSNVPKNSVCVLFDYYLNLCFVGWCTVEEVNKCAD